MICKICGKEINNGDMIISLVEHMHGIPSSEEHLRSMHRICFWESKNGGSHEV